MDIKGIYENLKIIQDTSLKSAMKIIEKEGFGIAYVIDEEDNLIGYISDGDIRRAIFKGYKNEDSVKEIFHKNIMCIDSYWDIKKVKEYIKDKITDDIFYVIPVCNNNEIIDLLFYSKEKILSHSGHLNIEKIDKIRPVNRVLVIGGAGFIGSVLVRTLLSLGYKVTVLDSFMYGVDSLKEIKSNENLTIIKGDTRRIEDVTKSVKNVDAVVQLAELVGDPVCIIDPELTQQVNYLGTKLIASVCKHFQINRFVYLSSCSVYGASENETLLDENSPLSPVSLYARMKIECEKALTEMIDDNFSPTILRLATVYGTSHRPRFDLVVNVLSAKAIVDKNITIYGGEQWRPNVHVNDVGQAIIRVLESPLEKVKGNVFNVGSNEQNYKIKEIGLRINKVITDSRITINNKIEDRRNYNVDFTKIKNILGFNPTKQVEDGAKEIKELFISGKIKNYEDKIYSNVKTLHFNKFEEQI